MNMYGMSARQPMFIAAFTMYKPMQACDDRLLPDRMGPY